MRLQDFSTFSAHRSRKSELLLCLIFLLSLPLLNPWVRGDGVGYYALVRAPLIEHNLDFTEDYRHASENFREARVDETADRVLVHVDTEQAGEKLVHRRLPYVAVSRGRYDAQVYPNDKSQRAGQLSRDVSQRSAIEQSRESASLTGKIESSPAQSHVQCKNKRVQKVTALADSPIPCARAAVKGQAR